MPGRPLYAMVRAIGKATWIDDARCADGADPDLFFTERPSNGGRNTHVEDAKKICATCPVRQPCLTFGMGLEFGIYGGITEDERAAWAGTAEDAIGPLLALHASQTWGLLPPDSYAKDWWEDLARAKQLGFSHPETDQGPAQTVPDVPTAGDAISKRERAPHRTSPRKRRSPSPKERSKA